MSISSIDLADPLIMFPEYVAKTTGLLYFSVSLAAIIPKIPSLILSST